MSLRPSRITAVAALSAALALGTAACTAPPSTPPTASTAPGDATQQPGPADIMFVQMMIPHHEQAVEMSEILLAKSDMPADMVELATSIAAEQGPEIEQMQQWQEDWGLPEMPGMNHGGHGGMDGMLSEDELDELRDAEGDGAVTLFLEQMIAHHEGAIDMAQDVVDRGEHADVIAMATAIIESQRAEIALMNEMLNR